MARKSTRTVKRPKRPSTAAGKKTNPPAPDRGAKKVSGRGTKPPKPVAGAKKRPPARGTNPPALVRAAKKGPGRGTNPPKAAKPAGSAEGERLPLRQDVNPSDCWDLSSLYESDAAWEQAFEAFEKRIPELAALKGTLGRGAESIAVVLQLDADLDRAAERLGVYAYLKAAEDQGSSTYQRLRGKFQHLATKASEAGSWVRPELMSIDAESMNAFLKDPALAEWALALERILRYRPHTLGDREEQLLAMQGQMSDAANQVFRQLNDADLKWGMVKDEKNRSLELSHSSFATLLRSPKRSVRAEAFAQYYGQFDAHKNTLAAAYNGSVQRDAYYAKARGYPSAREASLFHDNVPTGVYDSLIEAVHRNLPTLYRYYDLRKRVMKLRDIRHYDTYVSLLPDLEKLTPWDDAVDMVVDALTPLGTEYVDELRRGLNQGRWCDRYPNQGKQSGAFSYGTFDAQPYILMNYQPKVLDHVFTLAHEAGHSMHSWYSARHQPFQYYNYTIFVAEVASTFNEQLLLDHLIRKATTTKERAFLLNHAIDEIRGTIIRQTMFAEFEKVSHELVEKGEPLTVQTLRTEYRKLLDLYFGPGFAVDEVLELECLRIPHFYRAFYVYKYATGLSAAIALSQRVLAGGERELNDYLGFLKGGCSKFPLDLLRGAGVDMETPQPVDAAMKRFGELVDELAALV